MAACDQGAALPPRAALLFVGAALLCACPASGAGTEAQAPPAPSAEPAPPAAPRVVLLPAGADPIAVRVEIASTEDERRRGLMFRQHLEPDAGMLFLFERPDRLSFWMRNTYVALDLIFIEPSLRVLGVVENATPMTDTPRFVAGQSQFVLEVNAGFSRRNGINPGTAVRFEGLSRRDEAKLAP